MGLINEVLPYAYQLLFYSGLSKGLGCLAGVVRLPVHPICTDRMRTGKRNRHRRPDSPDPNPKSKRDDISINQLT
ncbi:hypothetical protein EVAR_76737_1 [Eumeta japonica]|uniref:Uncharacterized protein n=1 Tax=Eumeta variegata TaxID=151549 RepID=A0A4C1ST32_EUMVA|nr:hypothetical protein EVAR_76737_1 [Eumeta japonica]